MSAGDTRQAIVGRIERYLESWRTGDAETRRRLFAPQAWVEDPVGSGPREGRGPVEAHWEAMSAGGASSEAHLRRVIVCGREALAVYTLKSQPTHGPETIVEMYAVFEFDAALEIRRMRVFRDDSCVHVGA